MNHYSIAGIHIAFPDGTFNIPEFFSDNSINIDINEITFEISNTPVIDIIPEYEPVFSVLPWDLYKYNKIHRFISFAFGDRKKTVQAIDIDQNNPQSAVFYHGNKQVIYHPIDQLFFQYHFALNQILMFHGCAFSLNGKGFIILGESGAGKSTVLKNLLHLSKNCSENLDFTILNDERNVVYSRNNSFKLAPTPWHGELDIVNNIETDLDYILFLDDHEKGNIIAPLPVEIALQKAVHTCFLPYWDREFLENNLATLENMISCFQGKLFSLSYNSPEYLFNMLGNLG